jgi:DNA-binding NarL/FixJ family response regulator
VIASASAPSRGLADDTARAGDLLAVLLTAHDFTQRESAVTMLLVRGLTAREIAAELSISHHTVRDHTKGIYEKAGVDPRGELVAQLFSNHVLENLPASVPHLN